MRVNGDGRRVAEQKEPKNQHAACSGLTRAYPPLPSIAPAGNRDAAEVACTRDTLQGGQGCAMAVASLAKTVGGRERSSGLV